MREVLAYLKERVSEFERHLSVARLLEARINDEVVNQDAVVEVRHINTLKSGLLIHLYNIVEAVTTRTLEVVGQTVVNEKPKRWTEAMLQEWVRAAIWAGEERIGDGALKRLVEISSILVSGDSPSVFKVKGEPGSWDDVAIKKVAKRLGCRLTVSPAIRKAISEPTYRDEKTAMQYLARRRNAIAHGEATFEDGVRDHTLREIEELAGRIFPFLGAVAESYEKFLTDKNYLMPQETAA
jgi:hypothetical protein